MPVSPHYEELSFILPRKILGLPLLSSLPDWHTYSRLNFEKESGEPTMSRKTGIRLSACAVGAAAMVMIAVAPPAAAQDRYVTAWGKTSAEAVANANNFCVNKLNGKLGGRGWGDKDGSQYVAHVWCTGI
jgi:hypothetical protein